MFLIALGILITGSKSLYAQQQKTASEILSSAATEKTFGDAARSTFF
jgi:hypothetical protein